MMKFYLTCDGEWKVSQGKVKTGVEWQHAVSDLEQAFHHHGVKLGRRSRREWPVEAGVIKLSTLVGIKRTFEMACDVAGRDGELVVDLAEVDRERVDQDVELDEVSTSLVLDAAPEAPAGRSVAEAPGADARRAGVKYAPTAEVYDAEAMRERERQHEEAAEAVEAAPEASEDAAAYYIQIQDALHRNAITDAEAIRELAALVERTDNTLDFTRSAFEVLVSEVVGLR